MGEKEKKKLKLPELTKDLLQEIINSENFNTPKPGEYYKVKSPDKTKEVLVSFDGFDEYINTKTGEWTIDNRFSIRVVDKKNRDNKK